VFRSALICAVAIGCAPVERPAAHYDPTGDALFDAPWPTDDRVGADGLDLSGFPGDGTVALLERYLEAARALPGWGPSSPVYVPLTGLPDPAWLPDPIGSISPDSPILLLDLDAQAPDDGAPIPVQWELLPVGVFVPSPTLAVAPLWGFPLAPGHRHALVVTTEIVEPNEAFAARLAEDPSLADLRDALDRRGRRARDVAVATVFTPRDPLAELDVLVDATRALPAPQLDVAMVELGGAPTFRTLEISVEAPLWMHGSKPFAVSGGGFRFDEAGDPIVAEWETLRLAVSVPLDAPMPASGYPVVLYGHGTGGDYDGFASGSSAFRPAAVFAANGIVGIGFDQPLHGTRGTANTNVELHSFNYLNPESARAGFRQGGLDLVWLLRALTEAPVEIALPEGGVLRLDPDAVAYMGHSHGGLTGALALPWIAQDLRGAVLSGAGGGLAISIVKRKDPLDIAALVGEVLGLGPDEALTPLHPVPGLVQLLAEETDPVNYAPAWLAEDRGLAPTTTHILLTSGRFDAQTDHETAEALAIAGRLTQVRPSWNTPYGFGLRGLTPVAGPARDTITGFDGVTRTAGFSQWEDGDHFVLFEDGDARDMYGRFLRGAFDGAPEIAP
jgi:hypothetical protein